MAVIKRHVFTNLVLIGDKLEDERMFVIDTNCKECKQSFESRSEFDVADAHQRALKSGCVSPVGVHVGFGRLLVQLLNLFLSPAIIN